MSSDRITGVKRAMDKLVHIRMVAEEAIQLLEEAYGLEPVIKNQVRYYSPSRATKQTKLEKKESTKK